MFCHGCEIGLEQSFCCNILTVRHRTSIMSLLSDICNWYQIYQSTFFAGRIVCLMYQAGTKFQYFKPDAI